MVGMAVNVWIVVVAASAAIISVLLLVLVAVALDSRGEPPFCPFPLQVLDFGWIDTLPDGTPCLGNWWPDTKKFPQGLKPLSDAAHAAGMIFGIHMALPQVNL